MPLPVLVLSADPQDNMYWWGTFDMIRRLFQTSVIVLVRIVDDRYDTVYAVLVSFFSGLLQVISHKGKACDDVECWLLPAY